MPKTKSKTKEFETASDFEGLPDSEKEQIYQELDAQSPQERLAKSTPLDARDRARQRKFMR
jgi:hypothetical protein